uniref:Uncharacterized protein n=1 Tax=Bosea sp. NBC_00436 TaxID=2969620 RepID=A0A9E7ZM07_9HYPH
MLTTRIIAAAFGAATLLGAAMSSAPASAAPISAGTTFGAETGLIQQAQYYGRPRYAPGRPHVRRCWTESRRVWVGHRWVRRAVRVCR